MAVNLDSLSLTAVPIELIRKEPQELALASASAFLWRSEERYFLVSNLHNFAGWDFSRNQCLSSNGATPTHLRAHLRYKMQSAKGVGVVSSVWEFELFDEDGRPVWLVHPTLGHKVDVGALALPKVSERVLKVDGQDQTGTLATIAINDGDYVDFRASAGDDAYVLGYPRGLDAGKKLPIWKRASIASEPGIDVNDLPVVLIDTATRQGMSGSPVIYTRRGYTIPIGKGMADAVLGESNNFLGVYSGRIGDDELGVQLGWVWKGYLVQEIVTTGKVGALPY
jgi:hypothetical protein